MSFGEPIRIDDRFGNNMNNFLNLVNSASLTYNVIQNEKTCDSGTHFNSSQSVAHYHNTLIKQFKKATSEFELTLAEILNKQDKLSLITHLVAEIDSFKRLLKKNNADLFSHRFFQISNLSQNKKDQNKVIDESNCQDYYYWMNEFLEKMKTFLKNYKEDVGFMSQIDIINHPSMFQDKNASTKNRPLKFFEYMFTRNGINFLRENFINYFEEHHNTFTSFDPKTETIFQSYNDSESGDIKVIEWEFKDFYLKRLIKECEVSRMYINDYIDEQQEESTVTFFLKQNFTKLNLLLKAIDLDDNIKKYNNSAEQIKRLMWHINEKKSDYADDEKQIIPYFKIKIGAIKKKTAICLFDVLVEKNYIEVNSKSDFVNAFTGSQPANKIKWTRSFGDLKTFINHSIKEGLIEENNSKWLTTANIFTNDGIQFDHKTINNTKVTKNKTAVEKMINSIINSAQP